MYGLLGKKLSHSMSPFIHKELGNDNYHLIEKDEDEVEDFIKNGEYIGLNVTIPYKKKALEMCDFVSDEAKKIGNVNTIKKINGKIYGYNTDYFGFYESVKDIPDIKSKSIAILGQGATSNTVWAVFEDLGVKKIKKINSRQLNLNYKNLDFDIVVNCTPVGMYPNNHESLLNKINLDKIEYAIDLVYNPFMTNFLYEAKKNGAKIINGINMLVNQAVKSSEIFLDKKYQNEVANNIIKKIYRENTNIVLIGMPGSGKTTIAKYLGEKYKREVIDIDEKIVQSESMTIEEIFAQKGEEFFRDLEGKIIQEESKKYSMIMATGGGSILRDSNICALNQNSIIFYVKRDLQKLELKGRPLSKDINAIYDIYEKRKQLYEKNADFIVLNENVEEVSEEIWRLFYENIGNKWT